LLPPVLLLPVLLPTVLLVGKGEEEVSLFMMASPLGLVEKIAGGYRHGVPFWKAQRWATVVRYGLSR